ncbi:MAG: dihydrofolate reductase [Lachnospiraceae bacterium]
MNLIAAVDKNWGIGCKNQLLVSIPQDMKFFRSETGGKVVIMGRKTLESFPNKQPLKNRTNIVLTKDSTFSCEDAIVVHDLDALFKLLKQYPTEDVYVIGGGSIYTQLVDYCDVAYITKIDHAYQADTYFPNLDEKPEWVVTGQSEEETYFDLEYCFIKYEKKKA